MSYCLYVHILLLWLHAVQAGPGTTPNIEEIFIGKCWNYQNVINPEPFLNTPKNCTDLWLKFRAGFAYRDPCDTTPEDYREFAVAADHYIPPNTQMFWETMYPFVNDLSNDGQRYVTVADTLLGYMADQLFFCGQQAEPGINYDECPLFGECQSGQVTDYNYWIAVSNLYGERAFGKASVMLNGSFVLPSDPQGIFRQHEFVHLLPEKNVTALDIYVVHNLGGPISESCGEGSILNLTNTALAQGLEVTCVNNPSWARHYQCIDDVSAPECSALFSSGVVLMSNSHRTWPGAITVITALWMLMQILGSK